MSKQHDRIPGLDLIRAIAILLVVFAHSSGLLAPLMSVPLLRKPVSLWIDHSQPVGTLGVELFFVLSGFLIGNILIKRFLAVDRFTFSEVKHFWVRRWLRTLPNYWLILTVNIILYSLLHLRQFVPAQLLYYPFLQNFLTPCSLAFFNEAWSLSIEEWFYLTLPVALCLASVLFNPVDKRRFLLRVFLGYLFFFIIARFVNAFHPINGADQDSGIRKVVLFRLDAVMYGVLFAYLSYFHASALLRTRKLLLLISLSSVAILFYLMEKRALQITASPVPVVRFLSDAFLYMLLPLSLSLCLPYASSIRQLGAAWLHSSIRFISQISYSMYLVHFSLVLLPFFYTIKVAGPLQALCSYLLYWAVVITLSWLLFRFFESPIMKLRDKL